MALFRTKFACNSAFRNSVFRWESCKGSVWESVKKNSSLCTQQVAHDWILRLAHDLQVAKSGTCVEHADELNSHVLQKVWTSHSISLRLELATQSSCEAKSPIHYVLEKLTLRIPFSPQYKYLLYPRNVESFQREFWERNRREKQDWLIHNLYIVTLQIPQLSSSPLLHPWEVHYPNPFIIIPISVRRSFRAWKAVRNGPIDIGWCYGL